MQMTNSTLKLVEHAIIDTENKLISYLTKEKKILYVY